MLDLIIIGGAAAGSSAAIYASRAELNLKLISQDWGGEVARSGDIYNYPGFKLTHGIALTDEFKKQVEFNKVTPELGITVTAVDKQPDGTFKVAALKDGLKIDYQTKTVIIATGVHPRKLSVPGEADFKNKGVSYCSTCDGPLFRNKTVVVVGGGNTAAESALFLSKIATKVYMITINPEIQAEAVYIHQIENDPNITVIKKSQTTRIIGKNIVEGLEYTDLDSSELKTIQTQGVFVHIGFRPNSSFIEGVEKNKFGEIIVDQNCQTAIPGLFAAGDVTDIAYKQIVISAGQGAVAALSAINYVQKLTK